MTRHEVLAILDGTHSRIGRGVALSLQALIVLSAVAIALETEPGMPQGLQRVLFRFELFILAVFTAEYLLRLVCAPHRWRYVFSFWGIVDLLAILPALVFFTPEWQVVRTLRLLRLVRLFKLFRSSRALDRLVVAFKQVRGEMMIFGVLALLMLYVSAVGIYVFEHEAQPEVFNSIPKSLWWAVASFTTVGYGDMYPITAGGRIFTTFVLFIGLGIIAVPAAIVTTALLEAETSIRKRTQPETNPDETKKGD